MLALIAMYAEAPFDRVIGMGGQMVRKRFTVAPLIALLITLVTLLISSFQLSAQPVWWVGLIVFYLAGMVTSGCLGRDWVNASAAACGISWGGLGVMVTAALNLTPYGIYSPYIPIVLVCVILGFFLYGWIMMAVVMRQVQHESKPDDDPSN